MRKTWKKLRSLRLGAKIFSFRYYENKQNWSAGKHGKGDVRKANIRVRKKTQTFSQAHYEVCILGHESSPKDSFLLPTF